MKHTDKELLIKIIKKATQNGWKNPSDVFTVDYLSQTDVLFNAAEGDRAYYSILFSKDFARAFFGEEVKWFVQALSGDMVEGGSVLKCEAVGSSAQLITLPHWKGAMQEYVVMDNPLDYFDKCLQVLDE